jgi:hypothetical protein
MPPTSSEELEVTLIHGRGSKVAHESEAESAARGAPKSTGKPAEVRDEDLEFFKKQNALWLL